MTKRAVGALGGGLLALVLSGCTTLVSLLEPNSPKIYGGVRMSLEAHAQASAGITPAYGWSWCALMLVDFPLSLVTDTVFLPVTVLLEPSEPMLDVPVDDRPDALDCRGDSEEDQSDEDEGQSEDEGEPEKDPSADFEEG